MPSLRRGFVRTPAIAAASRTLLVGAFPTIEIPVVIAAGGSDRVVDTDRQSRRLHAELPGSRFELIAGAGHMIHYSDPNRIADLIRSAAGKERDAGEREEALPDGAAGDISPSGSSQSAGST